MSLVHGGYSSGVERQIVVLVVVGSNPTTHPLRSLQGFAFFAPVAQLDRASDFESAGRTFESCRAHRFAAYFTVSIIFNYLTKQSDFDRLKNLFYCYKR